MGLPTRPQITLLIGPCAVGEHIEAIVVLSSDKPFRLDALHVAIHGREFSGDAVKDFLALQSNLVGARKFEAGQHRLPFTFFLPAESPPSQTGTRCGVAYHASVHADVPWWPDRRATFSLSVVGNPSLPSESRPARVYHSLPAGAPSSEPHLELSLASDGVAVGDELHGAIAAIGCEDLGEFRIALESLVKWNRMTTQRGPTLLASLGSRPEEGMAPFRLKIPADTPLTLGRLRPSGGVGSLAREWRIEVSAGSGRRAMTLSAPIEIHGGAHAEATHIPVVGEGRIGTLWAETAAQMGFRFEHDVLHYQDGDVVCRVQRERVNGAGVLVTATLRYPHLGLDVRVEPLDKLNLLERMRTEKLTKSCAMQTRDLEQTRLALERSGTWLEGFLVSLDDDLCRLQFHDGGTDTAKLSAILAHVRELAARLQGLVANTPPPTGMQAAVPLWSELADALHSRLCVGDLHIDCARGSVQVSVRARFDENGAFEGTLIHGHPADSESLPLTEDEQGDDARELFSGHLEGELLERGVRAAEGAWVRLGPNGLALSFDWGMGDSNADSALELLRRVEDVQRVVAALASGERGPYR